MSKNYFEFIEDNIQVLKRKWEDFRQKDNDIFEFFLDVVQNLYPDWESDENLKLIGEYYNLPAEWWKNLEKLEAKNYEWWISKMLYDPFVWYLEEKMNALEQAKEYAKAYIDSVGDFAPTLLNNLDEQQTNPERFYTTLCDAVIEGIDDEIWEQLTDEEKEELKSFIYKYAESHTP